jgi:hypothetical protein
MLAWPQKRFLTPFSAPGKVDRVALVQMADAAVNRHLA